MYEIHNMDCVAAMRALPDNSVDSIVTDPPYELTSARPGGRSPATEGKVMKGFMGMAWDGSGIAYSVEMWAEALRVLKPGGHLLAFSGSRTYHRMTCAIEDAGFEVRDQIMWVYGSGFPKSLDVSKAIDKANGLGLEDWYALGRHIRACREAKGLTIKQVNAHFDASAVCNHWEAQNQNNAVPPTPEQWKELKYWLKCSADFDVTVDRAGAMREVVGVSAGSRLAVAPGQENDRSPVVLDITSASLDAARQWEGWGTALKPAHEPICVARKPLIGTVAANVLAHSTGGLNIDGCRIPADGEAPKGSGARESWRAMEGRSDLQQHGENVTPGAGRWPANLIHDGSDEVLALFPCSSVTGKRSAKSKAAVVVSTDWLADNHESTEYTDSGSASRFFYCAKTSKADRNAGCDSIAPTTTTDGREIAADNAYQRGKTERTNSHPTVKPTDLMAYLVRLVTPPGGLVLDPFMGSGSTGKACMREGFRFIGCELSAEYVAIAERRIVHELSGGLL